MNVVKPKIVKMALTSQALSPSRKKKPSPNRRPN